MSDQAETLRAYVAQNPEVKQMPSEPNYRALWLGLKAELIACRAQWQARTSEPWNGPRSKMLKLMEQAEVLSRVDRIIVP